MSDKELDIQISIEQEIPDIQLSISENNPEIEFAVESGGDTHEAYDGEYEADPKFFEEILGVTGSYSGEAVSVQSKSVTPSLSAQTVLPDAGYDHLSQVSVAAIPISVTDSTTGGKIYRIG